MFSIKKLSSVKINIASPETIREWSHGEVTKPETINYRNQKPEMDGLFCEKIFGPTKDFECYCGKYKKIRYQGLQCEKCGVDVVSKQVRRERMGHIELAATCAHIWFLKGTHNYIQILLNNISAKKIENIIYFNAHVCLKQGNTKFLKQGQYLDENISRIVFAKIINDLIKKTFEKDSFEAKKATEYLNDIKDDEAFNYFSVANFISKHTGAKFSEGASAIKYLLHNLNLKEEFEKTKKNLKNTKFNNSNRLKLTRRLKILNAFMTSDNQPEWMMLDVIPVIPPDLRPMLPLDGGRFATSDLNDLYRRIITRNNRLKKLIEKNAPSIILANEKRMLQESVDALIDNGRRDKKPITSSVGHPLKCLTAILKGKQGRLRQNLLGKRVDYSGRSVIAVGPKLRMHQCGIPREAAVQLLRPFIISILIKEKKAISHYEANKMIDNNNPIVYDIVDKIISDFPVLLNRAPTLHRLGIQAFEPKLIEGHAIRLHPLVCTGFNADFDGDQMAIHIPLNKKAKEEALDLMIASNNILGLKDGNPIVTPSQDMVLGNYYLTLEKTKEDFLNKAKKAHELNNFFEEEKNILFANSEGKIFDSIDNVFYAYETEQISLHNRIAILIKALKKDIKIFNNKLQNCYLLTSVGRIIFNSIFPSDFPFINNISDFDYVNSNTYLIDDIEEKIINIKDKIAKKKVRSPIKKNDLNKIINQLFYRYNVEKTSVFLDKIKDCGFKYSTISGITISLSDINVVENKKDFIIEGDEQINKLEKIYEKGLLSEKEKHIKVIEIWNGVKDKITVKLDDQLKKDIDNPLFIMLDSGARGSIGNFIQLEGMRGLMNKSNGEIIELPIKSSFRERMSISEFFIATHGARKGGEDTALKTANSGYLTRRLVDVSQDVVVREEDCKTDFGFVMREIKNPGENVKLVSLYKRIRGRYAMHDIKNPVTNEIIVKENTLIDDLQAAEIEKCGIKEVEIRSLFGCQTKDGVCAHCYGKNLATGKKIELGEAVGIIAAQSIGEPGTQLTMRTFHSGGIAESDITQGLPRIQELVEARNPKGEALISEINGKVVNITKDKNDCFVIEIKNNIETKKYTTIYGSHLLVKNGDEIISGQKLTQGIISPKKLLDVSNVETVENYMLNEIHKPYCAQGIEINDKHIEIIIKQMLSKVLVVDNGDTELLIGTRIDINKYKEANIEAIYNNKRPAIARRLLLGITKISLATTSFLSAASFQETSRVLTAAAIEGKIDCLHGLKESVITGKLIPAGRGLFTKEQEEKQLADFSVKKIFHELNERYK